MAFHENWVDPKKASVEHWAAGYPLGFTRACEYWRKVGIKNLPTSRSPDVRDHVAKWREQGYWQKAPAEGWTGSAWAVWKLSEHGTNTILDKGNRLTGGVLGDLGAVALGVVTGGIGGILGGELVSSHGDVKKAAVRTGAIAGAGVAIVAAPVVAGGALAGAGATTITGSSVAATLGIGGGAAAGGVGAAVAGTAAAAKPIADALGKGKDVLGKLPAAPPPPKVPASSGAAQPTQVPTVIDGGSGMPVSTAGQLTPAAEPLTFWRWFTTPVRRVLRRG